MRIAFFGDSMTSGVPGCSFVAMLRERFPEDNLINLGKGNDTVVSLYRRVARLPFDAPFDLAFLWIGVNDVSRKNWWLYHAFNILLGQRRARDLDEFRAYYRSTLELLCRRAARVVTVPPLLRGEDLDNRWNRQIEVLARVVEELTAGCEQARFLDLRAVFVRELAGQPISHYLLRSGAHVVLDALTLQSRAQVDRQADKRGLHLTLDGVHLNGAGAELVADAFAAVIRDEDRKLGRDAIPPYIAYS